MVVILLLQAIAFVQLCILLRSGDVEVNPGPGLHPGKIMCAHFNSYTNNLTTHDRS